MSIFTDTISDESTVTYFERFWDRARAVVWFTFLSLTVPVVTVYPWFLGMREILHKVFG